MLFKKLTGTKKVKPDAEGRIAPPGQYITEKFPVLTFGAVPKVDLKTWKFRIFGLVDNQVELSWAQFKSLPKVTIDSEFHCVTQWSRLENTWEGIAFSELMKLAGPKPEAKYVMAHCYGGYTTNQ